MTWTRQEGKNPSDECSLSSKLSRAWLTRAHHKGENPFHENFENDTLPRAQVMQARHEGGNSSDGELVN